MPWYNQLNDAIADWAAGLGWPNESLLRLALALAMGAAVGVEREVRGREAGLRTYALVCVGCALAMLVSLSFARVDWLDLPAGDTIRADPARIAYGVMAGIGFIGAGSILRNRGRVQGLTTAAGIWCVAALGLAAGMGLYLLATVTVVVMLVAFRALALVEPWLPHLRDARLTIRCPADAAPDQVRRLLEARGLFMRQIEYDRADPAAAHVDLTFTIRTRHSDVLQIAEQALRPRDDLNLLSVRWQAD